MSKEQNKSGDSMEEAEAVCDAMNDWTGAEYDVMPPKFSYRGYNSWVWFVLAEFVPKSGLTDHANALWKDESGVVWIESIRVGDTINWVELDYGEEGVGESLEMDLTDFSKPEVRREFGNHFPVVYDYITKYEKILAEVSSNEGVSLQMKYRGEKGAAFFYMDAKIETRGLDLDSVLDEIGLNIDALAKALAMIDDYEERREAELARNLGG
jgi:hypothetical protein